MELHPPTQDNSELVFAQALSQKANLLFCASAALLSCAIPDMAAETPDFSEAAAILRRGIQDHAFPGCTVAIGTADKLLWSAAFGCLDYDSTVPVTKDTLYDLASVTKVTGTTSVFMRLADQGKVRTSDAISKYLPEFIELAPSDEDKAKRKQVTVEQLLTHTAGLIDWKPYYRSCHSYREMLDAICKTPLESEPGARFRYSDFGMMLAGEVAARAGGKPLPVLEQELVFAPLGMTNTMRNPPSSLHYRVAPTEREPGGTNFIHGVVHDENSRAVQGVTGHAGLFSTAEDLAKLAAELLRADSGKSSWVRQSVLAEFARSHRLAGGGSHGLGWATERGSTRAISHNGFTGTYIRVELKRGIYLVLLTNAVHPSRNNNKLGPVRREFIDSVLATFDAVSARR